MIEFVGLTGIPLIRSIVKEIGFENGFMNVLMSLIVGIVLNVALAFSLGNDWRISIAIGAVAGFGSNLYNDAREVIKG